MTQHNRSLVTGLTFVATLGGLLFGYDTAVISGAVSAIDANFIEPLNLSETARGSLSGWTVDRKSTRLNSSHLVISYAVFCLKKKKIYTIQQRHTLNTVPTSHVRDYFMSPYHDVMS